MYTQHVDADLPYKLKEGIQQSLDPTQDPSSCQSLHRLHVRQPVAISTWEDSQKSILYQYQNMHAALDILILNTHVLTNIHVYTFTLAFSLLDTEIKRGTCNLTGTTSCKEVDIHLAYKNRRKARLMS